MYLIHAGIDTVKLGGKGFDVLVREGDPVSRAQRIMDIDIDLLRNSGYSPMVILVKL